MKKYTHAWLATMAIRKLSVTNLNATYRPHADSLIKWFMGHKDWVLQGAWYPDDILKDNSTGHILKISPDPDSPRKYRTMPSNKYLYHLGITTSLYGRGYKVIEGNLPDRCQAIAHSIIDNLKMQDSELKGSPIAPTANHIATLMFMLSHYIADAHVPFHCDSRGFSSGDDIHGMMEKRWEDVIKQFYEIDADNERFYYDKHGYPLLNATQGQNLQNSYLSKVLHDIDNREFSTTYGDGNENVWDFMDGICQYSYLASHYFIPTQYDHTTVTISNWDKLQPNLTFDQLSPMVLYDAIDSIAKIWLRVWKRHREWHDSVSA